MQLETSRFGLVEFSPDDILLFPTGIAGFEDRRHWILLADGENDAVGWLQNLSRGELAVPVVSPRRFAAGYMVKITRDQLAALQLERTHEAYVLAIVSHSGRALTLNLKAPLIINLDRRLGGQVVTNDDQPLQMPLACEPVAQRKSA